MASSEAGALRWFSWTKALYVWPSISLQKTNPVLRTLAVGCGQKKPQIPSSDDFEMRVMLQCLAQAACKPEGTREMMEAACTYKTCLEMQGAMMTYPSCANWLAEMWAGEELTMEDLGSVIRNKHGNYVCQEPGPASLCRGFGCSLPQVDV